MTKKSMLAFEVLLLLGLTATFAIYVIHQSGEVAPISRSGKEAKQWASISLCWGGEQSKPICNATWRVVFAVI